MGAANTSQVSPFQAVGKTIGWPLRFITLILLYFILFAFGGGLLAPYLPATPLNTVRMSHLMLETASSIFVFGLIVTWLLYPEYKQKS